MRTRLLPVFHTASTGAWQLHWPDKIRTPTPVVEISAAMREKFSKKISPQETRTRETERDSRLSRLSPFCAGRRRWNHSSGGGHVFRKERGFFESRRWTHQHIFPLISHRSHGRSSGQERMKRGSSGRNSRTGLGQPIHDEGCPSPPEE